MLARKKDAKDLANGIQWCVENNKDGKLSAAARKKVMENYTKILTEWVNCIRECMKRLCRSLVDGTECLLFRV